jgi:hypothetical protein
MKLLNFKSKNSLSTFIFKDQRVFKVESLLWDDRFKTIEVDSFGANLNIPEMIKPSIPVIMNLVGVKNGQEIILHSVRCDISLTENLKVNTYGLTVAINNMMNLVQNVTMYSYVSGRKVNEDSYFIKIESPVDLSNWIQYRLH